MKPKSIFLFSSYLALFLLTPNIQAQQGIQTAQVEEIVIYAQRRAQSIIDVPVQVTSLSGENLARNDVLTLADLGSHVPNTFFGALSGAAQSSFAIRGVGGTLSTGGEEPVALYFDGQFISRYFPGTLLDTDSVEVLRGPQATLYGRNATGGAVLLRSKRPGLSEYSGYGRVQYAEFNNKRLEGAIGGPLVGGKLAFRIASSYTDRDGFVTNTLDGLDLNRSKSYRMRAGLLWSLSENTEIYSVFEYGDTDGSIARAGLAADRDAGGNRRLISDSAFDQLRRGNFAVDSPMGTQSNDTRASVTLTHNFTDFDLSVSAGYFSNDTHIQSDSDGTSALILNNDGRIKIENYTQDLVLTSTTKRAFHWIVGFSAVQDSYDLVNFDIRNYSAVNGLGLDMRFAGITSADAYAGFVEGGYDITPQLTLTLGGRLTYEQKTADISREFFLLSTGDVFLPLLTFQGEENYTVFKPRAVLSYALSDHWNAYASISTGFKSGGFNVFGATNVAFNEEDILAYELGTKGRFLDGTFGISAAIFYYDYTDLQLRLGVPTGGVVIQNAADAEIYGFETEWDLNISQNLNLYGSFSLLETELIDYQTQNLVGELVNAGGNNLSRAPSAQFSMGVDYEFPVSETHFVRFGSAVSHRSEVFFLETDQDAMTFQGAPLTELDFRVTFGAHDTSWEITGFVQNLMNDVEATQIELQGNFPQASFNEPKKIGIELTTNF